MADSEDTNVTSTRDLEMDILAEIHENVVGLGKRIGALEGRVETLIQDVNTVHKFQQSFAERLSGVEKFCVERPLRSVPSKKAGNGGGV